MERKFLSAVDIGSTTIKMVIGEKYNDSFKIIFSRYKRHLAKVIENLTEILDEAKSQFSDIKVEMSFTGSAAMGLSEKIGIPFIQEVVSSADYIKKFYSDVRSFIEIGGEDSKIIFFDDNYYPDIRMNGNCAGGTGAFLDQMAVLLNIQTHELNKLAEKGKEIYPIATRCGVFAKTDIQTLLSSNVPVEDIALSGFHAVALQVVSSLTRGNAFKPRILFAGGPLGFFPQLRKAFAHVIDVKNDKIVIPEHVQLIPAIGAAINQDKKLKLNLSSLISRINNIPASGNITNHRLDPIFSGKKHQEEWQNRLKKYAIKLISVESASECFLGIDSGSTTTKIVLINNKAEVVWTYYQNNHGNSIDAVRTGLKQLKELCDDKGLNPEILKSAVTGYGEGLIKAFYNIDIGVVETVAHYRAASQLEPDVSFILDIGGQDMKAIFIQDRVINDIQINEACSSGCGSFIETFANNLGYSVADFAELACDSTAPYDLGTRCTVFMNSKVKQALRDGISVPNISAGLGYSVIKNSLYKVLKLKDNKILGENIVAQGGTFKNPSILRAMEILLGKDIKRSDMPEMAGAYGAALIAMDDYSKNKNPGNSSNIFSYINGELNIRRTNFTCKGCENRCNVIRLTFENGNHFYEGNRCERKFSNNSDTVREGINLMAQKRAMIFNRPLKPAKRPVQRIGIPRGLNMYENFPFWCTFFVECGFEVVVSDPSNMNQFASGARSIMSDNICFPAKLINGHILDLVSKKVDRIFYPHVIYEKSEFADTNNCYNCPVVTGYPDVIKSSINPEGEHGIPMDSPVVSFREINLLKKQLHLYMKKFGIPRMKLYKAVDKAVSVYNSFKTKLRAKAYEIISNAEKNNTKFIVLSGRPYQIDLLINHGIPELLSGMGVDVITEDSLPLAINPSLEDANVLTQWNYTNRLYAAAKWIGKNNNAEMVQITSFGCGLDAVSSDEVKDILNRLGKTYTLIKVDEVFSLGAVRIRLRSMLETIKNKKSNKQSNKHKNSGFKNYSAFNPGTEKKIIVPYLSEFYSPLLPYAFRHVGLDLDVLPPQNIKSIEYGLQGMNNEICYPAILIGGDIIKAFESGAYDPNNTLVLLTQTGGQCRASNYVPLIKKILHKYNYNVELQTFSSLSLRKSIGYNALKQMVKVLGITLLSGDCLAQLYLPISVREKNKGDSQDLLDRYIHKIGIGLENPDFNNILNILYKAVTDFNSVDIYERPFPQIGLVGEIFLKYNCFSNMNIIKWLRQEGVEAVLPKMQFFFLQKFINVEFKHKNYITRSNFAVFMNTILNKYIDNKINIIENIMRQFKFHKGKKDLRELSVKAGSIVNIINHFGEGWLIPADIIEMAMDGIENIILTQPFGCLSNHITGKGIEKRLKKLIPNLKLLALDFEPGSSEVNVFNRLHFLVSSAKESLDRKGRENRTIDLLAS